MVSEAEWAFPLGRITRPDGVWRPIAIGPRRHLHGFALCARGCLTTSSWLSCWPRHKNDFASDSRLSWRPLSFQAQCRLLARCVISRRRNNSVAFRWKRTFSELHLQNRIPPPCMGASSLFNLVCQRQQLSPGHRQSSSVGLVSAKEST
jgi:hypothetical protein